MTYKEIVDIYKTAFIVSLREAARETGNDIYLKVDKALDEHDDLIQKAVQDEVDFKLLVFMLCSSFFFEAYGLEELGTWDTEKTYDMSNKLYSSFLRVTTKKFCRKYGLEVFDELDFYFTVNSIIA